MKKYDVDKKWFCVDSEMKKKIFSRGINIRRMNKQGQVGQWCVLVVVQSRSYAETMIISPVRRYRPVQLSIGIDLFMCFHENLCKSWKIDLNFSNVIFFIENCFCLIFFTQLHPLRFKMRVESDQYHFFTFLYISWSWLFWWLKSHLHILITYPVKKLHGFARSKTIWFWKLKLLATEWGMWH